MAHSQLPPFAPFPISSWRQNLPSDDWVTCQVAWATLCSAYLQLPEPELKAQLSRDASATEFLTTFAQEVARDGAATVLSSSSASKTLLHTVFDLSSRILLLPQADSSSAPPLLTWTFLADLSRIYTKKRTGPLLATLSSDHPPFEASLLALKKSLTRDLESGVRGQPRVLEATLSRLNHLLHASPDAASVFLAGSDFLDGLVVGYRLMDPPLRRTIVATAYLCLFGLIAGATPKFSMLSDQLYALKEHAETHRAGPLNANDSLVPELVTATPLLRQALNKAEEAGVATSGLRSRITALESYKKASSSTRRARPPRKRRPDKGKAIAIDVGEEDRAEMHMHRMSQISQIQDLFPNLGTGFVAKLLDEYEEDTEAVIAHLLEESLPPHLANADHSEELSSPPPKTSHAAPAATPPTFAERRNIYDDDELDELSLATASKLHFGKRNPEETADRLLEDRSSAPGKAAILSALAAFDSDDDERDDTYDADDVGGTVDPLAGAEADADREVVEEALYRAYQANPRVFGREASARTGRDREALRRDTGMADEAIEGWAVMLGRSPQLRQRLENKYTSFSGAQSEISSSRWRQGDDSEAASDSAGGGERGGHRGGGRGRGRGRGGRGGGGGHPASGESGENTEASRRRKEANKASRANHDRRAQRARKMARGGGMVG